MPISASVLVPERTPRWAAVVLHERLTVAREARQWVGTPFHHGARLKGIGVDCAQFVVGVYTAMGVYPEPGLEEYPAQWMLHTDDDRMVTWLERLYVPAERPRLGDLAAFRAGRAVSHCGIVVRSGDVPAVAHADPRQGVTIDTVGPGHALSARLAGYWTPRRWYLLRAEGGA